MICTLVSLDKARQDKKTILRPTQKIWRQEDQRPWAKNQKSWTTWAICLGLACFVMSCIVLWSFHSLVVHADVFSKKKKQTIFERHLWACATKAWFQSNSLPFLFHLLSVPGAGDFMVVIEDCGSTGWARECIYNKHLYVSVFCFWMDVSFLPTFNFVLAEGKAGATCQAEGDGARAGICFTGGASSPMVRTVLDKYNFEQHPVLHIERHTRHLLPSSPYLLLAMLRASSSASVLLPRFFPWSYPFPVFLVLRFIPLLTFPLLW